MLDSKTEYVPTKTAPKGAIPSGESDRDIMRKIRLICGRGNNAEIKQRKDGTLAVMEVKKNIV